MGQCVESCSKTVLLLVIVVVVVVVVGVVVVGGVFVVSRRVENQMSCKENFALKCVLLFPIKLIECVALNRKESKKKRIEKKTTYYRPLRL